MKWSKAGPLGKLHNSIVFIRCSPQCIQRFKEISKTKGLLRDNDTRWNFKYYMTTRAIKLADQINYFCSKEKDLKLDSLSEQNWAELKKGPGGRNSTHIILLQSVHRHTLQLLSSVLIESGTTLMSPERTILSGLRVARSP